jgi:hypothetical protein
LLVVTATPVYLWQQRSEFQDPAYGLALFMFWNIVFVFTAGILLDIGENNRTRFGVDPFLLLLGIFFLRRLLYLMKFRNS